LGLPQVRIAPETMRRLVSYDWPGNIREMENVIERGMILCEGGILLEKCLPDVLRQQSAAIAGEMEQENLSIKKAASTMEQELIRKALARTNGNRTTPARILR
jgi:two-component system response regulator AtoC